MTSSLAIAGIKIQNLIGEALDRKNVQTVVRKETIKVITTHLENALRFHRRMDKRNIMPHRWLRFLNLPYSATYVTNIYILVKLLYLINAGLQFILLNAFLETDKYSFYGLGALKDILSQSPWETSGIFPRVTLCDFEVREMGNIVPWTGTNKSVISEFVVISYIVL